VSYYLYFRTEMRVQSNFPLKKLNTFGLDIQAKLYSEVSTEEDILLLIQSDDLRKENKFILGGGSNILFTKNLDALCIYNAIKGITSLKEDGDYAWVKAGAGEVWHHLVLFCIENNWGGVENLSLIPGSTGAAPIQNIGAYGVELKETFYQLEAIHLLSGEKKVFSFDDCRFGYRDSVFKREFKNQFIITSLTLRLNKKPKLNTSYGAIELELKAMNVSAPNVKAISQAVINIRKSKLPDPAVIGNCGSFFKNPEVSNDKYSELKKMFADMVAHATKNGMMKLSAGWMIEQCGWKGKQVGNVGMHAKQALVLVNYGNASGKELYDHALKVKESVKEKFDVELEIEVNVL